MSFEDIPEDKERSYPCECGGTITKIDNIWSCDSCDFKRDEKENEDGNNNGRMCGVAKRKESYEKWA